MTAIKLDTITIEKTTKPEKKMKREKKEKSKKETTKKRDKPGDDDETQEVTLKADQEQKEEETATEPKSESSKDKSDIRKRRLEKKAAKEALLLGIPKVDENGIAYTKIQLRRMAKRVKRGLNPIPTIHEEQEMNRMAKIEKKAEEDELAGLFYAKENTPEEEDGKQDDENDEGIVKEITEDGNSEKPKKHPKRSKPVPEDYTCLACQNKHSPCHWIYDCPDKVTRPGSNQKKKEKKERREPQESSLMREVFISGLPFGITKEAVTDYFRERCKGEISKCQLITFSDSKKCRGQVVITFATEELANNALALDGSDCDIKMEEDEEKKDGKKTLRLSVSRNLSKSAATKRKKSADAE